MGLYETIPTKGTIMSTDTANIVIHLTSTTKEFFKLMNFEAIPEDANYLAFFADGNAAFFSDLQATEGLVRHPIGSFHMIHYYKDIILELQD